MKNLLLAIAAVALFATTSSFAQKINFGIGADLALPITSGFSDAVGIGIGGTAKVYYPLKDEMVVLTGTAGYMTFSGKSQTIGGQSINAGSWSMMPLLVGARYYFAPLSAKFRPYGGFDMGMIFSSFKIPSQTIGGVTFGGGSASGSDFTYQPQLGFVASQFDVAVRFLGVSGASCIAARFGYIFN